jgi:MFS transporter, PAT family, beta-lactamase induction signal transducer AmpG
MIRIPMIRNSAHRDSAHLFIILLLGFSSGLPLALTASTLSAWLLESGVDKTSIGLFAAVATPYALKFLWAPFMDAAPFPLLSKIFGRRRGWILATQIALIFSIVALGFANPAVNPWATALCALIVAFLSASQDIVIDAYRVEILTPEQQGLGAAMVQYGYRFGMLASGAGALALADHVSWLATYIIMACVMGIGMVTVLFSPEPEVSAAILPPQAGHWLKDNIIAPFKDFMTSKHWIHLLLFIMLYKLGDAFLGIMTNPFLLEIGFTKTEIATVVKVYGLAATLIGVFLGGVMTMRLGTVKTLMICGIGHALTNLMFLVQARAGADVHILALGIFMENLSGGMTASAFVAFISGLTHARYTATQYALLSSLAAMGRTWLTTTAGWTADTFGWEIFFIISVLLAAPGLVILGWLSRANELQAASSSR